VEVEGVSNGKQAHTHHECVRCLEGGTSGGPGANKTTEARRRKEVHGRMYLGSFLIVEGTSSRSLPPSIQRASRKQSVSEAGRTPRHVADVRKIPHTGLPAPSRVLHTHVERSVVGF